MEPTTGIRNKIIHGKGIFMFLRSVMTSQVSSYVDYFIGFVFYAWVGLGSGIATSIGATAGGIVNCLINYKFTFKIRECSYMAIGIKFFLIWLGSMLLNSFGTAGLTHILENSSTLDAMNMADNLRFTIARLTVAIIVSVFWNFLLQRFFVFRSTPFDNLIDRCHYFCSALFSKRKLPGQNRAAKKN